MAQLTMMCAGREMCGMLLCQHRNVLGWISCYAMHFFMHCFCVQYCLLVTCFVKLNFPMPAIMPISAAFGTRVVLAGVLLA